MSSIGQGSISIDESTRIGQNAQETANEVAGNVNDINSDNKLTPSEKIKLKQEYDKDLKLYTIDVSQLQSAGLPTTELETAMGNLTAFITPLFKEMNRTSSVDRNALDSVFTTFATADKNASQAFVNTVQQVANDAKQAGDDAKDAGEKAQAAGEAASQAASQAQADATQAKTDAATAQQKAQSSIDQLSEATTKFSGEITEAKTSASQAQSAADNAFNQAKTVDSQASSAIAVQSAATAKAQSTADNAFSQAVTAIDNGKVTSQAVTDLKDGSTLTIAQLENGLASKVSNSDYTTYKTQTANQIGQMVTNSNFSAYQQTTADLISSKVATKDFSAYQATTAKSIDSKVESSDFNTYKTQTAGLISSKVESSDFQAYQTQVNDSVVGTNLLLNAGDDNDADHPVKMLTGGISVSGFLSRTGEYTQITAPPSTAPEMYYRFVGPETNEMHGLEPGQTYTIQGEVSVSKGDVRFRAQRTTTGGWANFDTGISNILVSNSDSFVHVSYTFTVPDNATAIYTSWQVDGYDSTTILRFRRMKLEKGSVATDFSVNPLDTATKSQITQLSGQIDQKVDSGDFSSYKTQTASLIGSKVDNGDFSTYKTQTDKLIGSKVSSDGFESYKTQTADLISQAVKKNDVVNQINISNEGILIDGKKVHITGNTSIDNAVIKNTMMANAAINTAQIADGAINNAKIANASIDDAKISNLNGNKLIENSITANKINVDDLIANGINTKTLTAVNLNASTLTTPKLNLGINGTFTEDYDYTQNTSWFLPKKSKGTLTFNHGVLESKGNMQTYVSSQWGGMNDNLVFQSGIDNDQWTEVAPGYIKMDLYKQNDADIVERTYIDPTGYYYKSANGIASYLGNVLQTSQVQTPSVFAKYIGPSTGELRLQIGQNGNHYGLQVGSYAGQEAVLSDFIYNSTVSYSPDVHINSTGRLVRTTSASKYKYNIKNPDIEDTLGDRLLNVHLATWNDKRAVDSYAEQLSTGKESEKSSIDKFYGLIAEQLRDAGLDMFISYGKNHEIEGIQYDRAWVPLLSVIRRLNNKVNEYELRLSKLEGTNK